MLKPIWAGAALLGTAGAAGAYIVVPGGEEEVAVQVQETAMPEASASPTPAAATPTLEPFPTAVPTVTLAPGEMLFRWANVTLVIPDLPHLLVNPESTPTGSRGIRIIKYRDTGTDPFSTILLDAENGSILIREVLEEDRPVIDSILATMAISDPNSAMARWPYSAEPPPESERQVNDIAPKFSFLPPAPETGFRVYAGLGDPGGEFVGMTNGRSTVVVGIDRHTGQRVVEFSVLSEEDRVALERWVATVKICGPEIEC